MKLLQEKLIALTLLAAHPAYQIEATQSALRWPETVAKVLAFTFRVRACIRALTVSRIRSLYVVSQYVYTALVRAGQVFGKEDAASESWVAGNAASTSTFSASRMRLKR